MSVLRHGLIVCMLALSFTSGGHDEGSITILFTSDVRGRIRPAG